MRFLLQLQLSVCVLVLFTASSKQTVSAIQENECYADNGRSRHTYNPTSEECCNGFVYSKRFGYECCGNDMFESSTGECCSGQWILNHVQTCCDGVAYDLQDGMICCGHGDSPQVWMNMRTQTCCYDEQENIFETRNGRGICCGLDQLYIPGAQMCCESGFLSTVHDIDHPQEAGQLSCCGLETYNNTIEQCCESNDNVQPWSEYTACCGSGSYDIRTEVCCKGIPQPLIGGRTQCCYQRSYNEAMETCCHGELFPIGHGSCCGPHAYSPTTASCCWAESFNLNTSIPTIPGVQECCDGESFLNHQHVCCDGNIHEKSPGNSCCGSQLYDTQSELCCSKHGKDTILPKHSEFTECCSDLTYQTNTQICCAGQVGDIIGGRCCKTADPSVLQPYDPKIETCCENHPYGQTYEGADQKHNCCGSKLFNNQTQICHDEDVFDKALPHHDSVCPDGESNNDQTYDSKTYACNVQGSLVLKRPGERKCGGRLYHPDSRICCGGYQYDRILDGEERQCCGVSIKCFVPSRQTCSNHKVYDIPQDLASACGRIAYNSKTHFCFHNIVVRPIESDNLEPCVNPYLPSAWYDPRESKCDQGTGKILASDQTLCNGVVFDTPGVGLRFGKCCNGLIGYNPWTEFCCGGRVHNISEVLTCCGDVIHNEHNSNKICCSNHLRSTRGGKTICTNNIAHRPDQAVCGVNVINEQTEICCDGMTYPRLGNTSCCGRVSFDNSDSTKLCCDNTLYSNPNNKSCCGTQLVDPANTTCKYIKDKAYGVQIPLAQAAFCIEGSYDSTQHTCCSGILLQGQGQCCGYSLITDPSQETCCGGKVQIYNPLLICCNGITYESRHYMCCGNEALHVRHSSRACCNNVIYNVYDQNCNGGVVSQKGPVTRRPYRSSALRRQAAVVPVCGNRTFDSRTSGCCSGEVYSIFSEKCENGSVARTKCEVCHYKNKSRKLFKRACTSDLILLVKITDKHINSTNKMITLTAEHIAVVKNLQDLSHESMQVMKLKVPKACQCNKVINSSGSGNYMIMTNSAVDDDDMLWLQPGDSLTRSKDADFGKLVRRMLRLCENEETVFP